MIQKLRIGKRALTDALIDDAEYGTIKAQVFLTWLRTGLRSFGPRFSAVHHPPHAVGHAFLGAHVHRMLIAWCLQSDAMPDSRPQVLAFSGNEVRGAASLLDGGSNRRGSLASGSVHMDAGSIASGSTSIRSAPGAGAGGDRY